ncbi:MAG: hypothetical protein KF893_17805 [Caldilineaceae bacterium]|nr:hypothetical protein [Caldilineaceae bacterium]
MGELTLHLPKTLESALEAQARQEGVSLEQYVLYALARQVETGTYTVRLVPQQDLHEQQERFQTLLTTLGKPSPTETEAILAERALTEPEEGLTEELRARLQRYIYH